MLMLMLMLMLVLLMPMHADADADMMLMLMAGVEAVEPVAALRGGRRGAAHVHRRRGPRRPLPDPAHPLVRATADSSGTVRW